MPGMGEARDLRVAIIGAGGQLGQVAAALAARRGWAVQRVGRRDLTLERAVEVPAGVERFGPTHLLVAAAYTAVDRAEEEPGLALAVNALAVGRLAAWAGARGVRLVYPSTDYVFAGDKGAPYLPDDPPSPINRYGESKALGERGALACPGALVARTAGLYGVGPGHFPAKILRAARAGAPLRVVDDQVGSPTWVVSFARTLLDLMAAGVAGVVHAACAGEVSWLGLASEALRLAGYRNEVEGITTQSLALPARRPARSALAETRWAEWGVAPPPPWQGALASFFGLGAEAQRAGDQIGGRRI